MSRCLVTGGLGFIGSHIVDYLRASGHEVEILDDCSANTIPQPPGTPKRYLFHAGDFVHWSPEVIFHTAAVSRTPPAIADPMRCHGVNVTGSLHVFELARKTGARVIHSSSNVVYGTPTPYRTSKLAAEMYATDYNTLYGGNIICLRYSNVIGPHLRRGDPAVLSSLRDCRDRSGYVEVTGDGKQTRNFTYVSDIVEANILAAFGPGHAHRGILDITTGIPTSMNEFARHFGCPIRYIEDRKGDTKVIQQSWKEAGAVLQWTPTVPFDEAMRLSLAWRPEDK